MNESLIGSRVVIRNDRGAYYGGVLRGETQGGDFLLLVDEICLAGDWDRDHWEVLKKPELMKLPGCIVENGRT